MEYNELICKRGEIQDLNIRYAQNGALTANFNLVSIGKAHEGKPAQIHKMACNLYRKENFDKYTLLQDGMQIACFGYWKTTPMKTKDGKDWELNQLDVSEIYVKLGFKPMSQNDVDKVVESFGGVATNEDIPFA